MAVKSHGRSGYVRGCRCEVCKTAERDYQRNRYRRRRGLPVDEPQAAVLSVVDSPPAEPPAHDCAVIAAVRAELDCAPAALERPGLAAVALAMAAILDEPRHVATQPAAARQLVAVLDQLHKSARRRGKLAAVKSMTITPMTTA